MWLGVRAIAPLQHVLCLSGYNVRNGKRYKNRDCGGKIKLRIQMHRVLSCKWEAGNWLSQPQKTSKGSSAKFRNHRYQKEEKWNLHLESSVSDYLPWLFSTNRRREWLRPSPSRPFRKQFQSEFHSFSFSYLLPTIAVCWKWPEIRSMTIMLNITDVRVTFTQKLRITRISLSSVSLWTFSRGIVPDDIWNRLSHPRLVHGQIHQSTPKRHISNCAHQSTKGQSLVAIFIAPQREHLYCFVNVWVVMTALITMVVPGWTCDQ